MQTYFLYIDGGKFGVYVPNFYEDKIKDLDKKFTNIESLVDFLIRQCVFSREYIEIRNGLPLNDERYIPLLKLRPKNLAQIRKKIRNSIDDYLKRTTKE